MKINGLNIDTEQIADGIFTLIIEQGEEHILAFGMIPKWAIDSVEKGLREKIIEIAAEQQKCSKEDIKRFLSEDLMRETMRPILQEIAVKIGAIAAKNGLCVV